MTVNCRGPRASNMIALSVLLASLCLACVSGKSNSGTGSGGMVAADAGGTGGRANDGDAAAASGGTTGSGGASVGTGGAGTGGAGTGGASTGGASGMGTGGLGTGGSGSGGSATGGAGTGGAAGGASGAPGTGGAAGKACSYKLCEDFESGTAGGLPSGWTMLNGYGADAMKGVGLAGDQFHTGQMALKSSSMTPGQGRVQKSLAALGATAAKHWGRIFYKVQPSAPKPASGAVIHFTLAALQGTTENRIVDTVEMSNGTRQWLFNVPDDSCCTSSSYDWSFDVDWHCAEWYVDATAKSYRFFTDNTEVTSIAFTGNANAKMSTYTALGLGAIFYQTPPTPFVIWFDDLAIDDAQIHCQ